MPATSTDYDAHVRATRATFPDVVRELQDIVGAKLCAYIGSVKETRAVHQWAEGVREPGVEVQRRLPGGCLDFCGGRPSGCPGVVPGPQPAARRSLSRAAFARG